MYNVIVNYDQFVNTDCKYYRDGREHKFNSGEAISINSLDDITCVANNISSSKGFININTGEEVKRLENRLVLYPVFNNSVTINYIDESNCPKEIIVEIGQIPKDIITSVIDSTKYSIVTSKLNNLSTYESIPIDRPIRSSGKYNLILDPIITFSVDGNIIKFNEINGTKYTIPASKISSSPSLIIKNGYTFNNWMSDQGIFNKVDFTKVTKPLTFTPLYTQNRYSVKFNGCGDDTTINVTYGEYISKNKHPEFKNIVCEKQGQTFNGWVESFAVTTAKTSTTSNPTSNASEKKYSIFHIILSILSVIVIAYILIYLSNIRISKSRYSKTRKSSN